MILVLETSIGSKQTAFIRHGHKTPSYQFHGLISLTTSMQPPGPFHGLTQFQCTNYFQWSEQQY